MPKHTLKEILAIFAGAIGHTHETAVQATYDAGHAQGRADALAEANEKAPAPEAPPQESAPAGAPNGEDDGHAQTGQGTEGEAAASQPGQPSGVAQEGEPQGHGSELGQADAPG